MSKVVLVTGGRYFNLTAGVHQILSAIHEKHTIECLHEGGATGADELCKLWALAHNIPVFTHEAEWKTFGPRAGTMRNSRMLRTAKPDMAVAFPGNTGTADMIAKLKKDKVTTLIGSYAKGSDEKLLSWTVQNG